MESSGWSAFEDNLRQLEQRTGLRITVVDLRGVLRMLGDLRLSVAIQEHRCELCLTAKSEDAGWSHCKRNKQCGTHKALRSKGSRFGLCHLGVTEHTEVLRVQGVAVAVFYLGQAVRADYEQEARTKMLRAAHKSAGSEKLREAFEELPRVSFEDFEEAVHQLRAILAMAAAVIRAEALPLPDLTMEIAGVEWGELRDLPPLVRRALLLIEKMPADEITVNALAAKLGCGREHLSRVFRSAMNISPGAFIKRQKLERARHLLEKTGFSLSEIAFQSGFADASHFNRAFREAYQQTPGSFRRRNVPPRE